MGLSKSIEYKNTGITLTYWRINMVKVDILNNFTEARIDGYQTKADALAGKGPLTGFTRTFVGSDNPIGLTTDPREYQDLLYDKFIETPAPLAPANPLAGATPVSDQP